MHLSDSVTKLFFSLGASVHRKQKEFFSRNFENQRKHLVVDDNNPSDTFSYLLSISIPSFVNSVFICYKHRDSCLHTHNCN